MLLTESCPNSQLFFFFFMFCSLTPKCKRSRLYSLRGSHLFFPRPLRQPTGLSSLQCCLLTSTYVSEHWTVQFWRPKILLRWNICILLACYDKQRQLYKRILQLHTGDSINNGPLSAFNLFYLLVPVNFSIGHQDYSQPQTEENVKYYKSIELPLVFSKVIWRRAGNYNDYFIGTDQTDILVVRMVVTEFGMDFALELFLKLAPKFLV